MKVDFADVELGCFEPSYEIEYDGKKYKAIDVDLTLEDGSIESHTISQYELEQEMFKNSGSYDLEGEEDELDNEISYYAQDNEGVYSILETITGEEME